MDARQKNITVCHRCAHRQRSCSGPCACTVDPAKRDIIEIATKGDCPEQYYTLGLPAAAMVQTGHWGSRMWGELHRRAMAFGGEVIAELAWFYGWCQGVGECSGCLMHWLEFIAEYPPDLRSSEGYFAWTVAAHNTVSARRGINDLWSVDRARSVHGQPAIAA